MASFNLEGACGPAWIVMLQIEVSPKLEGKNQKDYMPMLSVLAILLLSYAVNAILFYFISVSFDFSFGAC